MPQSNVTDENQEGITYSCDLVIETEKSDDQLWLFWMKEKSVTLEVLQIWAWYATSNMLQFRLGTQENTTLT